ADWLMNASWRFAFCAKAIKGDLVRQGAFTPAHICENNRSSQSTLVSPTRLADRASMRGSITLDVVRLLLTTNCSIKRQKNWHICLGSLFACLWGGSTSRLFRPAPLQGGYIPKGMYYPLHYQSTMPVKSKVLQCPTSGANPGP